jgi:hypothetical protein
MDLAATISLLMISCILGLLTGLAIPTWTGIRSELKRIADALERGDRITDLRRRPPFRDAP